VPTSFTDNRIKLVMLITTWNKYVRNWKLIFILYLFGSCFVIVKNATRCDITRRSRFYNFIIEVLQLNGTVSITINVNVEVFGDIIHRLVYVD